MTTLALYYHPLSSYCHKVLIAVDVLRIEIDKRLLNLGDAAERAAYQLKTHSITDPVPYCHWHCGDPEYQVSPRDMQTHKPVLTPMGGMNSTRIGNTSDR